LWTSGIQALTKASASATTSDRLTWLAEAIVAQALGFARTQLETQFGPRLREDGSAAAFAVIAYGKFGSIELGYGSDLDLVFVYDTDAPDAPEGDGLSAMDFFARVAQRTPVVTLAGTPTPSSVSTAEAGRVVCQMAPSVSVAPRDWPLPESL